MYRDFRIVLTRTLGKKYTSSMVKVKRTFLTLFKVGCFRVLVLSLSRRFITLYNYIEKKMRIREL